jgi:hypothetical protein
MLELVSHTIRAAKTNYELATHINLIQIGGD